MRRLIWVALTSLALLMACGGSRDRASGTRNGPGSPTGETPDSGVSSPGQDASTNGLDGGTTPGADGGTLPGDDAGPSTRDGGTPPGNLDRNAAISGLTGQELAELCRRVVAAQGTETVMCGDGVEINPTTQEECEGTPPGGSCTVGQVLDCMDSLQGDLCNVFMTPECSALFEC